MKLFMRSKQTVMCFHVKKKEQEKRKKKIVLFSLLNKKQKKMNSNLFALKNFYFL